MVVLLPSHNRPVPGDLFPLRFSSVLISAVWAAIKEETFREGVAWHFAAASVFFTHPVDGGWQSVCLSPWPSLFSLRHRTRTVESSASSPILRGRQFLAPK